MKFKDEKIINFNEKRAEEKNIEINNYVFRVTPVIEKEKNKKDKSIEYKSKKVLLEVVDLKLSISKVHPFSEFILLWKEKSYNTQKNKANTIMRFLNHILINNNKYKLSSFSNLEIYHGEDYLTILTLNGCSEKYFLSERNTLDKFYFFLSKKELLNKVSIELFDEIKINYNENNYRNRKGILLIGGSIFHNYIYPSNKKNDRRLHHLKEEFVIPFIETALEVEPRIALGVFFQCFGGLRKSEVVNVRRSSISSFDWGTIKLIININNEIISEKYKDYNQALNKSKRKQVVYNVGNYLPRLLKNHLIENAYYATDGSDALFSNKKGELLTSKMYSYYFEKIKREFINKLIRSENVEVRLYGMFLNMEKWSTHLGRGVASNFIADSTNSAHQVSSFRGDNTLDASVTYTEDTSKFRDMIYKSGSEFYEKGIEMNNKINEASDNIGEI